MALMALLGFSRIGLDVARSGAGPFDTPVQIRSTSEVPISFPDFVSAACLAATAMMTTTRDDQPIAAGRESTGREDAYIEAARLVTAARERICRRTSTSVV
ncbi:hypothetical protein CK223_28855 [Mesorhizobium loti]|nr:hypothetical protein CK223_28855 [Mesorhizobium loti]